MVASAGKDGHTDSLIVIVDAVVDRADIKTHRARACGNGDRIGGGARRGVISFDGGIADESIVDDERILGATAASDIEGYGIGGVRFGNRLARDDNRYGLCWRKPRRRFIVIDRDDFRVTDDGIGRARLDGGNDRFICIVNRVVDCRDRERGGRLAIGNRDRALRIAIFDR